LKCSLICAGIALGVSSSAYGSSQSLFANGQFATQPAPSSVRMTGPLRFQQPDTPAPPPPITGRNLPPLRAPEVDPGMATGGLSLLAGMLTIMRSRRRS